MDGSGPISLSSASHASATILTFVWYVFLSPSLSSFVTFIIIFVVVVNFFW
jgi:hypothetical protein